MKVACLIAGRLLGLLSAAGAIQAATPALPYASTGQSLGTVTCASSLCHGSITPFEKATVLHNEYVTWSRLDKHALAYQVLLTPRAQAMARKFGLTRPAQQAKACLDCHAHNVAQAQRGERFDISDGVSCEACHGPAQRWLAGHSASDASHAGNLAQGLYPSEQPRARAVLCLSCHSGNADKVVSHRLMAAGHPRLSFELDTFSAIAPAHYRVDADYRASKPDAGDGAAVWAIGQAQAVVEMMAMLVDPRRGRDGLFPELVLFDCHACHHPMSEQRWRPRAGLSTGPGQVRLNDSGMLMMRAIARALDPALGRSITAQIARLHLAVAGRGEVETEARGLATLAGQLAQRVHQRRLAPARLRGIALALIDDAGAGNFTDYAGAEQAAMAIASVLEAMQQRGSLASPARVNAALAALNASLADDERYRPSEFQRRLRALRGLIEAAP